MSQILSIKCPHCDAPHDGPASAAGFCQCSFCGAKFSVLQPAAHPSGGGGARLPAGYARPGAGAPAPAPRPISGARRVLVGVTVVVLGLALLGGLLYFRVMRGTSSRASRYSSSRSPRVVVPGVASPREPEVTPTAEFTHHHTLRGYGTTQYVFGMVKNTSPVPIDKPKVIVVLRDAAGREVDTRSGYAERELLPGESCAVSIMLTNPPAFASLAFETSPRKSWAPPRRAPGLRLEPQPQPERNSIGSLVFRGKVHNEGSSAARFVHVLIRALDAAGKIVGLASGYAEGERLLPGAAARYEVYASFYTQAAKYELAVEGRPAD